MNARVGDVIYGWATAGNGKRPDFEPVNNNATSDTVTPCVQFLDPSSNRHLSLDFTDPAADVLAKHGITYRKTKRAERIQGFDQAPDFIIPSEFNPKVIIEAKITEDDGTARDKATRIQHLGELSTAGVPAGQQKFQVIACIAGRGFGVRREDMKKMLLATRGKVFTPKTMGRLVECSDLRSFKTK